MERKIVLGIILTLLLVGMLTWAFNIQPVKASSINYRSFGSIVPPATEWNKTYGGLGSQCAYYLKQTSGGGYVLVGASGAHDTLIVRTDIDGNMIWNKTCECQGRAVQQTSDGGYIIGTGVEKAIGESNTVGSDAGLVKLYEDGNIEWNRTYSLEWYGSPFALRQTSDGGYVMAGPFFNGTLYCDFYLVKIDPSGNLEWNKTYSNGPLDDAPLSVEETSDGGFILAGSTWLPGATWTDGLVVKTDKNGDLIWNRTYGRPEGGDWINCVQTTTDGGYIMAGCYDRRPEAHAGVSGDFWLAKTDNNGSIQWSKQYGETDPFSGRYESAHSVRQTSDSGFIAVGEISTGYYESDIWLIKTDFYGNAAWNKTFEGSGVAVIQTNDGGYAVAGASPWVSVEDGSDMLLIKIMRANPPFATFTYSPTNPSVHQEIVLNASSSYDLDEDIVSYRWDFDDGNVSSTSDPIKLHSFESPGIFNVTLTVIDSEGLNSSYSQTVWARIITFISVSTSSTSTFVGFAVNVTGTLSDMCGNRLKNENVAIYYAPQGSETWTLITLDVTDNFGNYFATWVPPIIGHFEMKVEWAGNQTFFPTANITDMDVLYIPTDISITLSSSTSLVGFKIEINGNLTSDVGALSNTPILLSYSVTGGQTWNEITLTYTASDGSYSAVWMPSATGNYLVKALWTGNSTYPRATATVNLAVIPFEEQNVFSVISNSTVSALAFNSTSRELSFTVTGPSGTTGYVNVYIAKTLVENIADVKVYLNGEQLDYTATSLDDSWLLHFTYLHSTHKVTISLGGLSAPFIETPLGKVVLYGIPITAIVILIILYFLRKKQRNP